MRDPAFTSTHSATPSTTNSRSDSNCLVRTRVRSASLPRLAMSSFWTGPMYCCPVQRGAAPARSSLRAAAAFDSENEARRLSYLGHALPAMPWFPAAATSPRSMSRRRSSSPRNPLRMRYTPSSAMDPQGAGRSPWANLTIGFAWPIAGREVLKNSRTAFAVGSSIPAPLAASTADTAPNSRHSFSIRLMSRRKASASMSSVPVPDCTISPTRSRAPKNRWFSSAADASRADRMSSRVNPSALFMTVETIGSPKSPVFSVPSRSTRTFVRAPTARSP